MLRQTVVAHLIATLVVCAPAGLTAVLSVPEEHPTIQSAVNDASAGDVIQVAPGTYRESFAIPPSRNGITVAGDGEGEDTVRCQGGVSVNGTGIVIKNMQFEFGEYGVYVAPGASCYLSGVTCYSQKYGVLARSSDVSLNRVVCRCNSEAALYASGDGAVITAANCELCEGGRGTLFIIDNRASALLVDTLVRSSRCGIGVSSGARANLVRCRVEQNGTTAEITDGGGLSAIDCTLMHAPINVFGSDSRLTINGGLVAYCGERPLLRFCDDAKGLVARAEIAHARVGIAIENSSPVIRDNWIHDHALYGIAVTSALSALLGYSRENPFIPLFPSEAFSAPVITGNRFASNGECAISIMDGRPANEASLSDDNEFGSEDMRVTCEWLACTRVMYEGKPVPGASVSAVSAAGEAANVTVTDPEGFIQERPDAPRKPVWPVLDYTIGPGGTRVEHNPWTVRASSSGGSLRGSYARSWTGPQTVGDAEEGTPYQPLHIELNVRPVAEAGEDCSVSCDSQDDAIVVLDASGSSDIEDEELVFTWYEGDAVIAGPTSDPQVEVQLTAGAHSIVLSVDDGHNDPATDEIVLTVIAD